MAMFKNSASSKPRKIPFDSQKLSHALSQKMLQREMEEMADSRDFLMFCRIVHRVAHVRDHVQDICLRQQNECCLASIIKHRNDGVREDDNQENVPERSVQCSMCARKSYLDHEEEIFEFEP